MKIHLCSDLHLEFGNNYFPELEVDTIIVAGDINPYTPSLVQYLRTLARKYKNVIFVAGNHDYYGNTIEYIDNYLNKLFTGTNVHILQNRKIELEGVSFYGGTMWTEGYGNHDHILEDSINDFKLIQNFDVKRMRALHEVFKREWIDADVVVTHHVPDSRFTADRFKGSSLNGAFSCFDMQEYLQQPKFWCFGHTHDRYDEVVGSTRFLCNPYGYPHDYTGFDNKLIFEL